MTKPAESWGSIFRADLIAGLTVAAVAIPQAMAYGLIAGVEPRYALYTAIVMTALASILGSSAHLINGPTNAISLVVLGAVSGLGLKNANDYVQAVFLLSILVGLIQILIYSFKLGDLTRYISESVVLGFMLGAGLLIVLTQIPNVLGTQLEGDGHDHILGRFAITLWSLPDHFHLFSLFLGLATMTLIVLIRRLGNAVGIALPDMLLALIAMSAVAQIAGYEEKWPDFPPGLPAFNVPNIQWEWVRPLTASAVPLAVLGLLEAIAIAKSIAAQTRQKLDYNWQCLAEGIANLGGGFFQCIPGSGSLTRSAINFQAGARTRYSGVISAGVVAVTVVLFAGLAKFVPKPSLAGILLVTAWRLLDRKRIAYCLRATPFDRNLLLATAAAALVVSIEYSILIGVFLSFLFFVPRASRLRATELIVSQERVVRERMPEDVPCKKMVLMSLEGELFFGAAPKLEALFEDLEERVRDGAKVIVLRLKRARNPDMVCLERLHHFLQRMHEANVKVLLCGVRADFIEAIKRIDFGDCLPADQIYPEENNGESVDSIQTLTLTSTLKATKRAYDIIGEDLCEHCPRRRELEQERSWYYMI